MDFGVVSLTRREQSLYTIYPSALTLVWYSIYEATLMTNLYILHPLLSQYFKRRLCVRMMTAKDPIMQLKV